MRRVIGGTQQMALRIFEKSELKNSADLVLMYCIFSLKIVDLDGDPTNARAPTKTTHIDDNDLAACFFVLVKRFKKSNRFPFKIIENRPEMLAAYSLDRCLDDFMSTNNAVLNGEYGADDNLYKQCALLTLILYGTAIRPDCEDVRKQSNFNIMPLAYFRVSALTAC